MKTFRTALVVSLLCTLVGFAQSSNPSEILSNMEFLAIGDMTFVDQDGSPIPEMVMTDAGPVPYFPQVDANGKLKEPVEYVVEIAYRNKNKAALVVSNLQAWVLCVNQRSKDFSVKDWSMAFNDYIDAETDDLRPFYERYWSGELVRDIDREGPRESLFFKSTLPDQSEVPEGEEPKQRNDEYATLELRFSLNKDANESAIVTMGRILRLCNYINGRDREYTRLTLVLVGDANAIMSTNGLSFSQALNEMRLVLNLERAQGKWLVVNKAIANGTMQFQP